jgi:uncharacterized protein YjiS (DUF1127 family)
MIDGLRVAGMKPKAAVFAAFGREGRALRARGRYLFDGLRFLVHGAGALTHAPTFLRGALERHRGRRDACAAERAMMRLDDHLLRDIGLKRSDIFAATYSPLQEECLTKDPHSALPRS